MTHTPPKPSQTPSLGAAAAAAAVAPTPAKPATPAAHAAVPTVAAAEPPTDDKKTRAPSDRKVFIVVGTVTEFETVLQAEKFLNGPDAPEAYTVIRGTRTKTNKKVSLR